MKRMTGPKVFAEAKPTKYSEGIEDLKFPESVGADAVERSRERIGSLRKANLCRSTR